ncbi:MAG: hypothetical protein OFPI_02890 [Osedax symbiont Rs2]|nr:MAG: hypothetical protein OFPI_02890 [Osedax symbiont Rs2]
MSNYLFVQLPRNPADALQWLRWDTKKGYLVGRGESSADDIQSIAQATDNLNILLVPGEDVRSVTVSLPNNSRAALNTVPFQLEERFSSALENLHWVSAKAQQLNVTSLVCEDKKMQQWQKFAHDSNIKFRMILADYSLLPAAKRTENLNSTTTTGSAWSDGQRILCNSRQFQGAISPLAFAQLQSAVHSADAPLDYYCAAQLLEFFPKSTSRVNTDLLAVLAENFVKRRQLAFSNLLQGQYQLSGNFNQQLKSFKGAAIAAALLIAIGLAHFEVDSVQLQNKNLHLKSQMTALYQQLYPKDLRISNPHAQMRGKLKHSGDSRGQHLLSWLAQVAPVLKRQQISLVNLKYDQQPPALRLKIEASDYSILEATAVAINQLPAAKINASLGTLQKASQSKVVTSILTLREN